MTDTEYQKLLKGFITVSDMLSLMYNIPSDMDYPKALNIYAKQQQITVIEAAEEIFKNNTTFDETCSGKTNIIKTTLDKNIINNLVDINGIPMKGHGGNIIENTSFNLNSKSDNSSQKNMLTAQVQTVSIQKGIIKLI